RYSLIISTSVTSSRYRGLFCTRDLARSVSVKRPSGYSSVLQTPCDRGFPTAKSLSHVPSTKAADIKTNNLDSRNALTVLALPGHSGSPLNPSLFHNLSFPEYARRFQPSFQILDPAYVNWWDTITFTS